MCWADQWESDEHVIEFRRISINEANRIECENHIAHKLSILTYVRRKDDYGIEREYYASMCR